MRYVNDWWLKRSEIKLSRYNSNCSLSCSPEDIQEEWEPNRNYTIGRVLFGSQEHISLSHLIEDQLRSFPILEPERKKEKEREREKGRLERLRVSIGWTMRINNEGVIYLIKNVEYPLNRKEILGIYRLESTLVVFSLLLFSHYSWKGKHIIFIVVLISII